MMKNTFQSSPKAGKGATIKCIHCGFEKINDYPLLKKCTIKKRHQWQEMKTLRELQERCEMKMNERHFLLRDGMLGLSILLPLLTIGIFSYWGEFGWLASSSGAMSMVLLTLILERRGIEIKNNKK